MSYQTVLVEKKDGIATIRFNRPEKRNAMSPQLHKDMTAVGGRAICGERVVGNPVGGVAR